MKKIQIEHLTYRYESGGKSYTALEDVSLEIEAGEFVCLVGHSGCGKTTLLNLLAGLMKPGEGRILMDGKPVEGPGLDRNIIFQDYSLFPWLTAEKNVAFGIRQAYPDMKKGQILRRAREYLAQMELGQAAKKYPYQLSGGMRQRVAIARAFAMDGSVMLLDEPFGALDPRIRANLQQSLVSLWQREERKKTILFVTHDIDEAVLLADRILFMKPGRIDADIPVTLKRPRREQDLVGTAPYCGLRGQVVELFYGA